jgi:hypothetical protein
MSDKILEGLLAISSVIGFALAGAAVVLAAEIDYRWSVHSAQRRRFPNEKQESFVKYLFMAWFVRGPKWYERQKLKHREEARRGWRIEAERRASIQQQSDHS